MIVQKRVAEVPPKFHGPKQNCNAFCEVSVLKLTFSARLCLAQNFNEFFDHLCEEIPFADGFRLFAIFTGKGIR